MSTRTPCYSPRPPRPIAEHLDQRISVLLFFRYIHGPRPQIPELALDLGCIMFCFFDGSLTLGVFLSAFLLLGISLSVFYTSNTALVVGHAPANKEGITTAVLSFTTSIGSVLGVSLYEASFALRFPAGTRQSGLFQLAPSVLARAPLA